MSKNPGNSGHRYKMREIVSVEAIAAFVVFRLECGHATSFRPISQAAEQVAASLQGRVGQRDRCYECAKEVSDASGNH